MGCVALLFGLALSAACGDDDNGANGAGDPDAMPADAAPPDAVAPDASVPREAPVRIVVYDPSGNCSGAVDELLPVLPEPLRQDLQADGAQAVPLFERPSSLAQASWPPRLQEYCVVDFLAREAPPPTQTWTGTESRRFGVEPNVVIPQFPGSYDWEEARQEFQVRAGRPQTVSEDGRSTIRVAVIDTWPDQVPFDATSSSQSPKFPLLDHGFTVAKLVEDLLCGAAGPSCWASIETRAGIADVAGLSGVDRFSPAGGAQSELARAIVRAVAENEAATNPLRLVLNISAGWAPVPNFGGEERDPSTERPAAAAVWDAVRYARCHGAIVVAAAGNDLGGPEGLYDDGALYPARWDSADLEVDCLDVGSSGGTPTSTALIAVAATDRGQITAFQRLGSARLAAEGTHGVTASSIGGSPSGPTLLLNGSSVASAVVAAAAAAAWALDPTQDPADVEGYLTATSARVPNSRDWGTTGSDLPLIRICDALEIACAGQAGCAPGCVAAPPELAFTAADVAPDPMNIGDGQHGTVYTCSGVDILSPSGEPPICTDPTSLDEAPRLHEQPGCDACSLCFAQFDSTNNRITVVITTDTSEFEASYYAVLVDGALQYFNLSAMMSQQGLDNPPPPGIPHVIRNIELSPPPTQGNPTTSKIIWTDAEGEGQGNTMASSVPVYTP